MACVPIHPVFPDTPRLTLLNSFQNNGQKKTVKIKDIIFQFPFDQQNCSIKWQSVPAKAYLQINFVAQPKVHEERFHEIQVNSNWRLKSFTSNCLFIVMNMNYYVETLGPLLGIANLNAEICQQVIARNTTS